jgi:nucleoside-diphosphate kinase
MERTLVLIKPDAMQRGLAGEIIARLERRGLRIVGMRMLHMDEALAREHYAAHEGKAFFPGLLQYITSSPIIAAVFEGKNAVEIARQSMGATNPAQAAPGTIRGDLGIDTGRNLVHGSDSLEAAEKEIRLFFKEGETFIYERNIDPWVFE